MSRIAIIGFQGQYARAGFEGGPRAAVVVPGSSEPINLRSFGVGTLALRAQVEFLAVRSARGSRPRRGR